MNGILLVVAYVAAVNPLRTRLGLPESEGGRARMGVLAVGALLAAGGVWGLAGWSGPILDALQVSPETFRLAAGIVVSVAAIVTLVRPRPAEEPEAPGALASLWPIAYPRLLSAEVVVLALTTGTQEGVAATVAAAAVAFGTAVSLGLVRRSGFSDRVLLNTGRLASVLLVIVAVFLMVDGIRDV
jgi:small neutral amino acid transporter SnatA (MarC family)